MDKNYKVLQIFMIVTLVLSLALTWAFDLVHAVGFIMLMTLIQPFFLDKGVDE